MCLYTPAAGCLQPKDLEVPPASRPGDRDCGERSLRPDVVYCALMCVVVGREGLVYVKYLAANSVRMLRFKHGLLKCGRFKHGRFEHALCKHTVAKSDNSPQRGAGVYPVALLHERDC